MPADRPHRPRLDGRRGRVLARPAAKAGIKPILGCEMYVVDDHAARAQKERRAPPDAARRDDARATTTWSGWSRPAYLDGYWYKPRVDFAQLAAHADGIIALSGCLSGRVSKALVDGDERPRAQRARPARADLRPRRRLRRDPGRRHRHPDADHARSLVALAERRRPAAGRHRRRPLPDARPMRSRTRRMLCIQTQDTLDNPNRFQFSNHGFYLKSPQEMYELMARPVRRGDAAAHGRDRRALQRRRSTWTRLHLPQVRRARRQDRRRLPARAGRGRGCASATARRRPSCASRLEFELKTIEEMGFPDYFLIVWDFIRFARSERHLRRPGPRLGRGLAGRLLPAHHRPRPDALLAAVRAVPEPRPQDACPTSTSTSPWPAASA